MNMKKNLLTILTLFGLCLTAMGQTNLSDQVAQMWLVGQKQEVLDIANARLALDTNDIAGLLLKMEYEIEFVEDEKLTNTMNRISQVGSSITATNFAAVFPEILEDIDTLLELIALTSLTPAELAAERAKGAIVGKPFLRYDAIKALEDDGLLP